MWRTSAGTARASFIFFLVACLLLPGISLAEVQPDQEEAVRLIPLPELSDPGIPLTAFDSGATGASEDPRVASIRQGLKELKPSAMRQLSRKSAVRSRTAAAARKAQEAPQSGTQKEPRQRKKEGTPEAPPKSAARAVSLTPTVPETSAVQSEEDLKVRMRPIGTPRQIKVGGKAKAQSKVLRSARALPGTDGAELKVRQFLAKYRGHLRLDDPDNELRLSRSDSDSLQWRHFRFQQYHRGLPVWPAEVVVHVDPEGGVDLIEGAYIPTPRNIGIVPEVTPVKAAEAARAHLGAGVEVEATEPELIVYGALERAARLAWKLELNISLAARYVVVVDALNGEVLAAINTVMDANVQGAGVDVFGVSRPLDVWSENGTFTLLDTSKSMFLASSPPKGLIVVGDARNQPPSNDPNVVQAMPLPVPEYIKSGSSTSGWLPAGVSASFNMSRVYDYFKTRHGRNSIDGNGGSITAVVRLGLGYQNAFWASWANALYFGDGKPYVGALDIVAHEMAHGVTSNTAKLVYKNQSGALNEAFSDIFGENVENFVRGNPDWLVGQDLGSAMRSLKDPRSLRYPSNMSEYLNLPDTPAGDHGGVHINSSIINHAYYQLAAGLNGAIGIGDAERIFYRALTTHLTMQSNFLDARLACIRSAEELFGSNSPQAVKTAEAFDAVQIFDTTPAPAPQPGPTTAGSDAVLFLSWDNVMGQYRLTRKESARGDSSIGTWVSGAALAATRPSVSLDGTLAAFVTDANDLCLFTTDTVNSDNCLQKPGRFYSAAMSPDGDSFGFVLMGENGQPDNQITVINLSTDKSATYTLTAPASEGITIESVKSADAMSFSNNGRFLLYDAANELRLTGGETVRSWSIYALDMVTGQTLIVVPPNQDINYAYPSFGHTSDDFITFEGYRKATGESVIHAGNLRTGKVASVATVTDYGIPTFLGDDSAVIFSAPDAAQASERSLYRVPLAADHITPTGTATRWLVDADFADVYRRGEYRKLSITNSDPTSGLVVSDIGGISCGDNCSYSYPAGTRVTLTARPSQGATFTGWSGACSGTQSCTVTLAESRTVTATFRGTYTLSGVIRSAGTGAPAIAGATVSLAGKSATTDATGAFTVSGIAPGSYTLTISAPGFVTLTTSGYEVNATRTGLSFTLVPATSYVRVTGSTAPHTLLQTAYDTAATGSAILARGMTFTESPLCAANKIVTVKGGYDETFTTRSGFTTIDGTLRLRRGTLIADRVKIR